ncbi:hypothetical protein F183_A20960 [Bryobacterales bacterium F-183]|nr:hypothetical protein F183_A20960 [Bryobacterales bacterium F-183]
MTELIVRLQSGDREAAGELFARYWRFARASAFAVTGNWAAAEDVAAEGFWTAISSIKSLDDPARFPGWLRTIVVRTARVPRAPRHAPVPEMMNAEQSLQRKEMAALAAEAMAQLPEHLREAVALHYIEGYSQKDAAIFLEVPNATFRRRLHEGRTRLRSVLDVNLQRRTTMHPTADIERLKRMIAAGEMEQSMREIFAARPYKPALLDMLRKTMAPLPAALQQLIQSAARSPEAAPGDPAEEVVAAVLTLLTRVKHRRCRSLLLVEEDAAKSVFEALQSGTKGQPVLSETLDLTWEAEGLQEVQQEIEDLVKRLLPGTRATFAAYDEPRYRAAFQMRLGGVRAATGGILANSGEAYVRLLLEPFATLHSGQSVEYQQPPPMPDSDRSKP